MAKQLVAVKMASYTGPHMPSYDEKHADYLIDLSKAAHRHNDYHVAFEIIAEAIRNGQLPHSVVPEVVPPEPTPER